MKGGDYSIRKEYELHLKNAGKVVLWKGDPQPRQIKSVGLLKGVVMNMNYDEEDI